MKNTFSNSNIEFGYDTYVEGGLRRTPIRQLAWKPVLESDKSLEVLPFVTVDWLYNSDSENIVYPNSQENHSMYRHFNGRRIADLIGKNYSEINFIDLNPNNYSDAEMDIFWGNYNSEVDYSNPVVKLVVFEAVDAESLLRFAQLYMECNDPSVQFVFLDKAGSYNAIKDRNRPYSEFLAKSGLLDVLIDFSTLMDLKVTTHRIEAMIKSRYRLLKQFGLANKYFFNDFEQDGMVIKVEGLVVDIENHLINYGGVMVDMEPKARQLFFYLLQNPGTVLSRDNILENIWNDKLDGENVVEVNISRIRKFLRGADIPETIVSKIRTVRGQGYRFDP